MSKRAFIDAPSNVRCKWTITLKDGSKAQCGRRQKDGRLCAQHRRIRDAFKCEYCGTGNDDYPPEHTMDCESRK